MFMTDGGTINTYLMSIGIKNPPNWLSHPGYTKWVIIIMAVWKGLGSSILMYIAGMQGISKTYYEAAKIDGAGWFYLPKDYVSSFDACYLLFAGYRCYRRGADVC